MLVITTKPMKEHHMWSCEILSDSVDALSTRIRAEYHEMPGLQLTSAQAARLFGLDAGVCRHLLDALVASGVLVLRSSGRYLRRDAA